MSVANHQRFQCCQRDAPVVALPNQRHGLPHDLRVAALVAVDGRVQHDGRALSVQAHRAACAFVGHQLHIRFAHLRFKPAERRRFLLTQHKRVKRLPILLLPCGEHQLQRAFRGQNGLFVPRACRQHHARIAHAPVKPVQRNALGDFVVAARHIELHALKAPVLGQRQHDGFIRQPSSERRLRLPVGQILPIGGRAVRYTQKRAVQRDIRRIALALHGDDFRPLWENAAQSVVRRIRPHQQRLHDALGDRFLPPHIQLRADRAKQVGVSISKIERHVDEIALLFHAQLAFKRHAGRIRLVPPVWGKPRFGPLFKRLRKGNQCQRRQRTDDCFFHRSASRLFHRQLHGERRALAKFARHRHRARMQAHNLLDDGQA